MRIVMVSIVACAVFLFVARAVMQSQGVARYPVPNVRFWDIQAIDTMKDSRDRARDTLRDPSFDSEMDIQLSHIAAAGATHVAIGTPYDEEFVPLLTRWVTHARAHGLSVWFRGNWSGWEGWFGYKAISRVQHRTKTKQFIAHHPDLFADGDIFDPCPECENGGPGDPRTTGDSAGHKAFLESLYQDTTVAFDAIEKRVTVGVFSMNGDIASLIMGSRDASQRGAYVTVDHYVATPAELVADIQKLGAASGLPVLLGEFGTPIPAIHGPQELDEQASWLQQALLLLIKESGLKGLNYWTYRFGSTALWDDNNKPLPAAAVLSAFYKPQSLFGVVTDTRGAPIPNAKVTYPYGSIRTARSGYFELPYVTAMDRAALTFTAPGYVTKNLSALVANTQLAVALEPEVGVFWHSIIGAVNELNARLAKYSVPAF